MRKIKHSHHFNQKIEKKILKYRHLSWSARLVKIGSFSLYVSLASLTKTCLAADPVDAVRSQCGCSSKLGVSGCSSKLEVTSPVVGRDAFITAPDEREIPRERALALHPAVGIDVELGHTMPTIHVEPGQKLIFKIEGMCCPTEVAALKDALHSLNKKGREVDLAFDLINAKLSIERKSGALPTEEEIIKAVAKTGMKAKLWNEHVKQGQEKKTFWEKYGRYSLNLASAASLVSGLVVHAIRDGVSVAFGGGIGDGDIGRSQTYYNQTHYNQTPSPQTPSPQTYYDQNYYSEYPPVPTLALYSAAIVAASWFILPKAIRAIKRLRPDTNVLMVSATAGAIAINHWFEATSSMYLFSVAELLEEWNMARSRKSIRALMELASPTAQVVNADGTIEEQLSEHIPIGTTIIVRPGEKIPMDSVLILGSTYVNQAPMTGESIPIQKEVGDTLFAGTINEDSVIQCRVTKAASDSTLASIIRKIEEAQSSRSKADQWIEKFSRYYVPTMMATSVAVSIIPPLATSSSWYPWVYKGLELLVISCPCSLIISTPVSIAAGIAAAARNGVLIKGGVCLETAAHIKAFAMDKTGTLTTGAPIVQNVIPLNGYDTERLLRVAAALETHSDHPLARAIQRKAKEDGITNQPAESFQLFKGKGGEGYIDGELFWVGSHRFLHEKVGDKEPPAVHEKIQELEAAGHSIVAIGTGQTTCGLISIADAERPESRQAIQALKRAKVKRVVMLTGDNAGAAGTIAASVGVDEYYAELLPEDKVHQVEVLMRKYKQVAMVGDGINDAPAMAVSSLGIAMAAAGSDAAIETADIALMSDDLGKLAWLVKHSRATVNVIKQNVIFSLLVKGAFVGLTFANKSTLWMAMLSDMGASFIVVSNGLRLLKNKAGQRQSISGAEKTSSIVSFKQAELRWTDPTGIQKTFRQGQVLGDGDCGFTSLGIPSSETRTARETAIDLLREHSHEEAIRILVKPDLLERLIDPTDERTLPPSLDPLRVRFRTQHDVLLSTIEAIRTQVNRDLGREGDEGLGLDQVADHIRDEREAGQYRQQLLELNAIKAEMEAFIPTQDQTDTFLQDEFIDRREYLSYQRGGGGTLEALVRVMRVGVTVFTGDRTLSPTLHVSGPSGSQHFYLHHIGGTDGKGKTFLNHFNVLYEPHQRAELRWTDPTGIQRTFREVQVPGDGDCGFTSLGIPSSATRTARETAIALLREHAHEEAIRILVRPDLLERLIDPTDERTLPPSLDPLRVRFQTQHDVLLSTIESIKTQVNRDLGREGDEGLGLDQVADHIRDEREAGQYRQQLLELNAIKAEMEAFIPTQDQTDTFLQDEFIDRREYLSYQRGGGGTLEALVRVMRVGVTVFTGDRTLSPTLHVSGPSGSQHFYLHHIGGTDGKGRTFLNHFNVLYEPSSSPDSSVAAAAVDGDGSAKGKAAPIARGDGCCRTSAKCKAGC